MEICPKIVKYVRDGSVNRGTVSVLNVSIAYKMFYENIAPKLRLLFRTVTLLILKLFLPRNFQFQHDQ